MLQLIPMLIIYMYIKGDFDASVSEEWFRLYNCNRRLNRSLFVSNVRCYRHQMSLL